MTVKWTPTAYVKPKIKLIGGYFSDKRTFNWLFSRKSCHSAQADHLEKMPVQYREKNKLTDLELPNTQLDLTHL